MSEYEQTIYQLLTEDLRIALVSDDKLSACTRETKCGIMLQSFHFKNKYGMKTFTINIALKNDKNNNFHHHNAVQAC